ncbi:uncharacterized protein LOC129593585 [Paramacrobiotus metropolitanus]|uniref:uncharacterized protein LOC129593585 n=1 Tax=Paramacrobiotus metropolitanus TaxID=2943436 RepID=UPI00244589CD|nr:uncharacterized protein LOC129593585 [Paramacrobiotus metropolitanus]
MAALLEVEQAIALLLRTIKLEDARFSEGSVELLRDFHQVYKERIKRTTNDLELLITGVADRTDFVRSIRSGLTGSFGIYSTKQDLLKKLENLPSNGSELDEILQDNTQLRMAAVCENGTEIIQKMEEDLVTLNSVSSTLRSVCLPEPKSSMELASGCHIPFLSYASLFEWQANVNMFNSRLWGRIYELSPQDFSDTAHPVPHEKCVEYNRRCDAAVGMMKGMEESTMLFHSLRAETEATAAVCGILKQLNTGKLSWDQFYSAHYPHGDADAETADSQDRQAIQLLLEKRSALQVRLVEKLTEKITAETLLSMMNAVELAWKAYDDSLRTLLVYLHVLTGELKQWENLAIRCGNLSSGVQDKKRRIESFMGQMEIGLTNEDNDSLAARERCRLLNSDIDKNIRALSAVGLNLDMSWMKTKVLEKIKDLIYGFLSKSPVQEHMKIMEHLERLLNDSCEIMGNLPKTSPVDVRHRGRDSYASDIQNDSLLTSSPQSQ